MTPETILDPAAAFLRRLERALRSLPPERRAPIVAELRAHIAERCARSDVGAVLDGLGEPRVLARAFLGERRPFQALSPSALARGALRLAALVVLGLTGGACALLGAAFALVAAAKPFAPASVGLWMAPHHLALGLVAASARLGDERLGYGVVPLALLAAALLAAAATASLRACDGLRPRRAPWTPA